MGLFDPSYGIQQVRLAGPRRRPAHVHANDRSCGGVEEDHCAACEAYFVGGVAYEHARHIAEVT